MIELVTAIFAAYIITAVLVDGAIFYSVREWAKSKTPWLEKGAPYKRKHMLDCRMCVGAWVSLAVWAFTFSLQPSAFSLYFLIYGANYWLCTQERN